MKKNDSVWSSIGILIGAVIIILALAAGPRRTVLLSLAAAVWALWIALTILSPYLQQTRWRNTHKKRKRAAFHVPDLDAPTTEELLLRHVNHRISARLQAVYPDAVWEWCVKDPVRLIRKGGAGRIRVSGIPDYDHADIRIDRHANLGCNLVRIQPLNADDQDAGGAEKLPPNKQPVDPRIWYEAQGREMLERLVADLNSRGYSSLTLEENGDITIHEKDKAVPIEHFDAFPEKVYWPGLVKVLEGEGLAADATAQGIQITW